MGSPDLPTAAVRARGLEAVDPFTTNGAEEADGLEGEGERRQISHLPPGAGIPILPSDVIRLL